MRRNRAVAILRENSEISELLDRAGRDDGAAVGRLLELHRRRLWRLVANRLDDRLVARVDPSDIVQEALADAGRKLPEYVKRRPLPYYPWLCRLVLERLAAWRRFHLGSGKRSVAREQRSGGLYDESGSTLGHRLADSGTSPSGYAIRAEGQLSVRDALYALGSTDRMILELRYCEDLPFAEISERLRMSLGAVKMRHVRALERLQSLLAECEGEFVG